jgi:hypothetical protein
MHLNYCVLKRTKNFIQSDKFGQYSYPSQQTPVGCRVSYKEYSVTVCVAYGLVVDLLVVVKKLVVVRVPVV